MVLIILATANALAQAPVSMPAAKPDTLEKLEQSEAYKEHLLQTTQLHSENEKQIDSLFHNHESIVHTLKTEALKEWEAEKAANAKTLKELRVEETRLKKELRKEQKKTDNWLQKQARKSFKKTKYEDSSSEEE